MKDAGAQGRGEICRRWRVSIVFICARVQGKGKITAAVPCFDGFLRRARPTAFLRPALARTGLYVQATCRDAPRHAGPGEQCGINGSSRIVFRNILQRRIIAKNLSTKIE